jgi:uncharacterized membrane protein YbaN (DUF454 family)
MIVTKSQVKKWLLIGAGTLSVIMGVIGIFLPVFPTTPFLLLAAMCYMRSSERLYRALLKNRICGSYIRNYLEGRGMTIRAKILTLSLLWIVIVVTIYLTASSIWIIPVLLIVGIGVSVHILLIRNLSKISLTENGVEQYRLRDR